MTQQWKVRIDGARAKSFDSREAAEAAVREEWDVGGLELEDTTRPTDKRHTFDIVVDGGVIGTMWEVERFR